MIMLLLFIIVCLLISKEITLGIMGLIIGIIIFGAIGIGIYLFITNVLDASWVAGASVVGFIYLLYLMGHLENQARLKQLEN